MVKSEEYRLISEFYGKKITKRSKIPLMNHINEGMVLIYTAGGSVDMMKAFCLHPMTQDDKDLGFEYEQLLYLAQTGQISINALALSLEYRNIANAYLSDRKINSIDDIAISPLPGVMFMLFADKLQNYKDFLLYHKDTHPRSAELTQYFKNWIEKLKTIPYLETGFRLIKDDANYRHIVNE